MTKGDLDTSRIHQDIIDEIERDKSLSEEIVKYKAYVWEECMFMRKNNYILP